MSIESRSRQYGTVFEHWQMRKFLGQGSGGKSAVFLLQRTDSFEEESALKVINLVEAQGKREDLSPAALADYIRTVKKCRENAVNEVRLMAKLRGNTNIVDYLDHKFVEWEEEDGFGCDMLIRMERLTGLRTIINWKANQEQSFTEAEIRKIGLNICMALRLCQEQNILHRDIKPENIFVNERGNYKLGDFGVSRILSVSTASMASTGIGTPEYAAPEQMMGHYDQRVDIYSLGLVLYELSNRSRLPFAETRYVRQTDLLRRQSGQPLPAPCEASGALAEIILKACAFHPEDRYQTAEEFYAALYRLKPASAAPAAVKSAAKKQENPDVKISSGYETMPAGPVPKYETVPAEQNASYETMPADLHPDKTADQSRTQLRKKKKRPAWLTAVVLALILISAGVTGVCAFGYTHCWIGHDWQEADCEHPAACARCGAETGEATGHSLQQHAAKAPTCTESGWDAYEICQICGYSTYAQLAALGHAWQGASCLEPRVCTVCNLTEESAAGHSWVAADYTQPEHCSVCGISEGEPLVNVMLYSSERAELPEKNSAGEKGELYVWGQKEHVRSEVRSICFLKEGTVPSNAWDLSAADDGNIMAWLEEDGSLYIWSPNPVVLPEDSHYLFLAFTNMESIRFNDWVDTSGVANMRALFSLCYKLNTLDLRCFDTSNVTDMFAMFQRCESLTELDVSSFHTEKVIEMSYMFSGCLSLSALNLSHFITSEVRNMQGMFGWCAGLTSLDIGGFDTAKVHNMSEMFILCENLPALDLRSFHTGNVEDMTRMFCSCKKLEKIDIKDFDMRKVGYKEDMFSECPISF